MSESTHRNGDYLSRSVEIAIRLVLVAVVIASTLMILGPFLPTLVWSTILAIALFPVYAAISRAFGGRRKLAGAVFILLMLALILVPTFWLGNSLLDGTVRVVRSAREGTLNIPPPTEQVREWPLIGDKAWLLWDSAHTDLQGTIDKLQPQIGNFGRAVVSGVGELGGALLHTVLAIILAGVMMIASGPAERGMRILAQRLGGETGLLMMESSRDTIRSVVKGVILVALIQALAAAIGLQIAGVPAVGLWAFLVLCVAVIQLPPILVLGPIAAWVFANNDSTVIAVFFLIWSLAVSGADGVLKPILLGRGTAVPMPVVLVGAIGGMLSAGVLGLFIGPVILAIAWQLMTIWVEQSAETASAGE